MRLWLSRSVWSVVGWSLLWSVWRILLWIVLALFSGVVVLLILVETPSGTHLVFNDLLRWQSRLKVVWQFGSLDSQLGIQSIDWHGRSMDVHVEGMMVDSVVRDLLKGHWPLHHLYIQRLDLRYPPSVPHRTQLHRIWLPFRLDLYHGILNELIVQKGGRCYRSYRVVLPEAHWSGTHLQILQGWLQHYSVDAPFMLHLNGTLDFKGAYPVQATGWMSWPNLERFGMRPWRLELSDSFEQMSVNAQTAGGKIPVQLSGVVSVTRPYMPFQLNLKWNQVDWPWPVAAYLHSAMGSAALEGSLLGYRGDARMNLVGRFVPQGQYRLHGSGNWRHLELDRVDFQGLGGQAQAKAQVNFASQQLDWALDLQAQSVALDRQWPVVHMVMPILNGHWRSEGSAQVQRSHWTLRGTGLQQEQWTVMGTVPAWVSRLDKDYVIDAQIKNFHRTWPVVGSWKSDYLHVWWQGPLSQYHFKVNGKISQWALKNQPLPSAEMRIGGQGSMNQWTIRQVQWNTHGGQLDFAGDLHRNPDWHLEGLLQVHQLDLTSFGFAVPSQIQGQAQVQAEIPGDTDSRGRVGHYQLTQVQASGELQHQSMQLQLLSMQGLIEPGPLHIDFAASDLYLGSGHLHWSGQWGSHLHIQGQADQFSLTPWFHGFSGQLSSVFKLDGRNDHPDIQGNFLLKNPQWANYYADNIQGVLNIHAGAESSSEVQAGVQELRRGTQRLGQVQIHVQGTLDQNTGQVQWTAPFFGVRAEIGFNGGWQSELHQYVGTSIHSDFVVHALSWENMVPSVFTYDFSSQDLTVQAQCWVHAQSRLCLENSAKLGHAMNVQMGLHHFSAQDLSSWLPLGLNWSGLLHGHWTLNTQTDQRTAMHVTLEAPQGQIELSQDVGKALVFPYRQLLLNADIDQGNWVSQLSLDAGASGNAVAHIQVGLAEPHNLSGAVQVRDLDAQPFKAFFPYIHALKGVLHARMELSGSMQHPAYQGQFSWSNGYLETSAKELVLQQIDTKGSLNQQHMVLTSQFRSGAGGGQLTATTDWNEGPWHTEARLTAHDLSIARLPFVRSSVDAQVQAHMRSRYLGLSGAVEVKSAFIRMQDTRQSSLHPSSDVVLENSRSVLNNTNLWQFQYDVDVELGSQVGFSGFNVEGQLTGHLHLHQDEHNPWDAHGELDLDPEATFRAYGQMLRIRKGRLVFVGPPTVPQVDVEAVKDFDPNITVGVRVRGWADRLTSTLISDNDLSQDEISSYLIFGHAPERQQALFGVNNNILPAGAIPGVGAPVNNGKVAAIQAGTMGGQKVADSVGSALGVRDLAFTTQGVGTETQVALGGYLAPNMYLSYGVGVFTPVNSLTLRYRLNDRFYLQASTAFQNAIDLFYTWGF